MNIDTSKVQIGSRVIIKNQTVTIIDTERDEWKGRCVIYKLDGDTHWGSVDQIQKIISL